MSETHALFACQLLARELVKAVGQHGALRVRDRLFDLYELTPEGKREEGERIAAESIDVCVSVQQSIAIERARKTAPSHASSFEREEAA